MSYSDVLSRMEQAARRAGRDPDELTLVAVSKSKTPEDILEIYHQGHRDFGENRANEMAEKATQLPSDIRWHFVGSLQSNKARLVRPRTWLLHSMDRPSLARAWMKGPGVAPPALLQVNIAGEDTKSGVTPTEADQALSDLVSLGVEIRGLMAIPPIPSRPEESRPHFRRLRELAESLHAEHPDLSELSMGMSDDFEIAIAEGATAIRVGRAIFGSRN
ncbi:MAG: YggS family pyridoxal phosphate-dependent enzyme [Acidimicrobiia bacterium]|nr:YggS family pyridoxal phosphate-dependent enzyme [Acidimicrobiia bacterium]